MFISSASGGELSIVAYCRAGPTVRFGADSGRFSVHLDPHNNGNEYHFTEDVDQLSMPA